MPTIEERAREKLNEVRKEWSTSLLGKNYTRVFDPTIEAMCRALEAHDAERAAHAQFRQEVSDVARDAVAMLDEMAKPLLMGRNVKERLEKARSGHLRQAGRSADLPRPRNGAARRGSPHGQPEGCNP